LSLANPSSERISGPAYRSNERDLGIFERHNVLNELQRQLHESAECRAMPAKTRV
jgi:hypothetical protein